MTHRLRVILVSFVAIVLAIPLLPGPGVFIIMAALADVHDAFHGSPERHRPTAGFPPATAAGADGRGPNPLQARDLTGGRRVA
jgi:hypothetical protein